MAELDNIFVFINNYEARILNSRVKEANVDMDLKYYVTILWGKKWIIITTVVITVVCVIIGTKLMTPIYSASATLRIASASINSISYTDYQYADRLMNTYSQIATSRPVLNELMKQLNTKTLPQINVSSVPSTELMRIIVKDNDPTIAQNAANDLAQILVSQGTELYTGGEKSTSDVISGQLTVAENELNQARINYTKLASSTPSDTEGLAQANLQVELKQQTYESLLNDYITSSVQEALRANTITIVEPAIIPLRPTQPKLIINLALGIIVGLTAGIGIALLSENINPKVYSFEQVEEISGLEILGKIPFKRNNILPGKAKRESPINLHEFRSPFQKLQAKITKFESNDNESKSILFTSAIPDEGKSTIIANLAIVMGNTGKRVVVVDCDFHLPVQHKIFDLLNYLGLSTVLTEGSKLDDVIQKTRYLNTWILTSGPMVKDPTELLGSPIMFSVIDELKSKFDYILIDTPALLPTSDAIVLSPYVEGIILINRLAYCQASDFKETCKQLAHVDSKLLGVIVNDSNQPNSYYYGKYK